ncbi:hypothetical protein C8R45DRAFT_938186 [Mycena sanguinolenta]|nr:hypothetical protein C8R45DRAFT_938186 [Mycena sanguinolenta]
METPSLGFDNTMSMGAFLDDLYAKDAAEQAKIQEKLMKKKPKHYRRPNSGPGLGTAKGEKLKATGRASKRPAQEQPAECGPAESTSSPADVGVRKCTHCASTTSGNGRWVKSSLVTGQLRCNACYWYERKRGKIRPLQWDDQQCAKCHKALPKSAGRYSGSDLLCRKCYDYEDAKSPAQEQSAECGPEESASSPTDVGVRKCSHCASTTSSNGRWVKSLLANGQIRCNTCYWYEKKRGKLRPLRRDDQQCAKCHKVLLKQAGRYHDKAEGGSVLLCRKCYDYEDLEHHAQEQSTERAPPPQRPLRTQLFNAGTAWRPPPARIGVQAAWKQDRIPVGARPVLCTSTGTERLALSI